MKIAFVERRISAGPLAVLRHLYYYTVQYGLSVKQFTGKHQDYWAKELPAHLKAARDDHQALNRLIVGLERLGAGAEDRLRRRREQLKGGQWAEKEIVLNAQLLAVLAALPWPLLARVFGRLTGEAGFPKACRVVDLELRKERDDEDDDFVEPDLLLLGGDYLLMGELKTRGGPTSSRSYPPRQLLNYLRLVAECRMSSDKRLPKRFAHLILMPSTDLRWLERRETWVLGITDGCEGRLRVNPEACLAFGGSYAKRQRELLRHLLVSTPIYYRSWDQLAEAFRLAVQDEPTDRHRLHWERVGAEVEALAARAGKYRNGHQTP